MKIDRIHGADQDEYAEDSSDPLHHEAIDRFIQLKSTDMVKFSTLHDTRGIGTATFPQPSQRPIPQVINVENQEPVGAHIQKTIH